MTDRFTQKRAFFRDEQSTDRLQIKNLITLLDRHPYRNDVVEAFKTDQAAEEYILVDDIDLVFAKLAHLNRDFERFNIYARVSEITISESRKPVANLSNPLPLVFNFATYQSSGQQANDLDAYAIYDAKNTFFDTYEMSKYANHLYKKGLGSLAAYNLEYFKQLASGREELNTQSSYRMVMNDGEVFLRGITSVGRYFEYGVDFTFVVAMLLLHKDMKDHPGNNYAITSAGLSESKLELIIADKKPVNAGSFGQVSSAIVVTTNDLGQGSLNFTKIIRVGDRLDEGMYLYPKSENARENKLLISHSTGKDRVFEKLREVDQLLNNTNDFINDLNEVNSIKKPEELRLRIYNRLNNPRNALYGIQTLKDIFSNHINDALEDFVKLLKMCNKAEELDIDYDLKEKLRYLISDIILHRKNEQ